MNFIVDRYTWMKVDMEDFWIDLHDFK